MLREALPKCHEAHLKCHTSGVVQCFYHAGGNGGNEMDDKLWMTALVLGGVWAVVIGGFFLVRWAVRRWASERVKKWLVWSVFGLLALIIVPPMIMRVVPPLLLGSAVVFDDMMHDLVSWLGKPASNGTILLAVIFLWLRISELKGLIKKSGIDAVTRGGHAEA